MRALGAGLRVFTFFDAEQQGMVVKASIDTGCVLLNNSAIHNLKESSCLTKGTR